MYSRICGSQDTIALCTCPRCRAFQEIRVWGRYPSGLYLHFIVVSVFGTACNLWQCPCHRGHYSSTGVCDEMFLFFIVNILQAALYTTNHPNLRVQETDNMEFLLDGIDQDLCKKLSGYSIRSMKLKKLDKLLEGHKDHVLNTFIFWLQEGFIVDTAPSSHLNNPQIRTARLQSWCQRLRNHGFGPQRILDQLNDCTPHLINLDAVDPFHLETIKEEIRLLLSRLRGKKHRKLGALFITDNASSPQYSGGHMTQFNDNEEYRKVMMDSNKTDIVGVQMIELPEISSDFKSEMEILGSIQGPDHHHNASTRSGIFSFEGWGPSVRIFGDREQTSFESKHANSAGHDLESRSPPSIGIPSRGRDIRRGATTKQLSNIQPTKMDYDGINDGDDAILRLEKQIQGIRVAATKRHQEAEAQEKKAKRRRHNKLVSHVQEQANGNFEQLSSEPRTPRAQRSKMDQGQIKKTAKPHDEYLCYRCRIPGQTTMYQIMWMRALTRRYFLGHFLQDCPTNLDPFFDKIPVSGYTCRICGQEQAHLTSLCPDNTDPNSLTQLRLKSNTVTTGGLQAKDEYRPAYGNKQFGQQQRGDRMIDRLDDEIMNEARRRAIPELGQDDDQLVKQDSYESRHMRVKRKRDCSRQQSPQDGRNIDRHISPPQKRVRSDDQDRERSRERGRARDRQSGWNSGRDREHLIRFICPSENEQSSEYSVEPTELFASLSRPRADRGRLSYWDGADQTAPPPKHNSSPKHRGSAFSSISMRTKKKPLKQEFWSEDNRVKEIKHLFPDADLDWVNDMASFDVDEFLEEIEDRTLSTTSATQAAMSGMGTILEHSDEDVNSYVVGEASENAEDANCRWSADEKAPSNPRFEKRAQIW